LLGHMSFPYRPPRILVFLKISTSKYHVNMYMEKIISVFETLEQHFQLLENLECAYKLVPQSIFAANVHFSTLNKQINC
jgi:hypothetical protein